MQKNLLNKFFLLIAAMLLLLTSCSLTRDLEEDAYLLVKNRLEIEKPVKDPNYSANEMKRYFRQKPNRKILGIIPFYAYTYQFGNRIDISDTTGFSNCRKWCWKRKKSFKNWVMSNGEPPVILDTNAVSRTAMQIESFLFTRGYFSAETSHEIKTGRKKARVIYHVNPGKVHYINEIYVDIPSEEVLALYESNINNSLLKTGMPYDEKVIQQERDRITRLLKDSGFYHFNKAYIIFEADTFLSGNKLDLYLKILDQSFYDTSLPDSIITLPHKKSKIDRVFINPEYEGVFIQKDYDTIPFHFKDRRSGDTLTYYFSSTGHLSHDPQILTRNILIEPGKKYSLYDVEQTYLYLSDLGNFGNITISFEDSPKHLSGSDTNVIWLDCYINMSRLDKQLYEVRMDVTHRASDPGLASQLVYQNRNLFGGAEVVSLALKGALEVQKILDKDQTDKTIINNLPFNTVELGIEADIRVPNFVAPFSQTAFPKSFRPRTRFSGGVNYQERPDFKRFVISTTAGYEWQYRSNTAMSFNPIELNAVSISPSPSFLRKINELDDRRLRNSYTDHLITAISYSIIVDKQRQRSHKRYSFLRINLESAGFMINAFRDQFNYSVNDDGIAMIFNIPYAQYLRIDLDYRQFFRLNFPDQVIATRLYLGIGNPYGNMDVLPFEKSFYTGGANGIRAWQLRTLGPGGFSDISDLTRFDRSGDLGLEASLEYRFPFYSSLHGALFLDAGNVWLKNKNPNFPSGEFNYNNFIRQIAVGTGFGIRFVSFFVIRLDAGIKIRDPAQPLGERWVMDQFRFKHINWNLGIGYSI